MDEWIRYTTDCVALLPDDISVVQMIALQLRRSTEQTARDLVEQSFEMLHGPMAGRPAA